MRLKLDRNWSEGPGARRGAAGAAKAVLAALALGALLSIAIQPSPESALAQDEPPVRYLDLVFDRVDTTQDVAYGTAVDIPSGRDVELMLDIYEPQGDTDAERAAFIFVHGGGFVAGDRSSGRQYCMLMARRGYLAVSISYRLNQGNVATDGIPAATSDARQAVRWLLDHAEELRVDTDRVTMGGSSAGAITSLFVTYTDMEKAPGQTSSGIAAVMDLWGGLYIAVDEMEAGEPPLVIIHGTADSVVPFSEAEQLRERAEEVGVPYAWHPIEGAGHAPWDPTTHMTWTAEFFYDQLWPASGATPTATATATATPTLEPTTPVPSDTPTGDPTENPTATPTATDDPDTTGYHLYVPRAHR